ncbi:MAG: PIG-L family deacetylase [Candidatus Thermofonsia bacterium]|nr:MAG: PIG-L family deacetylase [Candidatus Thermofonsia bacterium]
MSNTYIPERALFIYAHPDDIEFGVAGTAALWAKHGAEVTYIVITDGNVGSHEDTMTREELAQLRRTEQTAAANVVGAKCIFLGYHDGLLQPTLELRKELVRHIRTIRPNVVVCGDPTAFFPSDTYINHPDHRAAAQAALEAVFPAAEMNLLYPDLLEEGLTGHKVNYVYVSFGDKANYYVDITETIDLKIKALRQHKSQLGDWDPEERIKNWAAEVGSKVGFAYAERFRRIVQKPVEQDKDN